MSNEEEVKIVDLTVSRLVVIIGDDGSTIAVDPFSGDVFTGTVESEKSKE